MQGRIPGYTMEMEVEERAEHVLSPTSVPVFLGYTARLGADEVGKPALLMRYSEYERRFCQPGSTDPQPWLDLAGGPFLRTSIRQYFQHGGGPCYVLPVGRLDASVPPDASHFVGVLSALESLDAATLILPTDAVLLPPDQHLAVCRLMLGHCASTINRICLLDAGSSEALAGDSLSGATEFVLGLGNVGSSHGACYFPWLLMSAQSSGGGSLVLPSALAAACCYTTDHERGVWAVPANIRLPGVEGLSCRLSTQEMAELYEPVHGRSVNVVRSIHGKGIFIWGARTLAGLDPDFRYLNVRRLVGSVEATLQERTRFAVFEPNDPRTWILVKGLCESFLHSLWEAGGLSGETSDEAYQVKVGLGETMTDQDILEGRLRVEIHLAPIIPTEFITLKIFHQVQALGQ